MREELSELIRFELSDPRIQGVEVAEVHCAPSMTKADVLVTLPSAPAARASALEGLGHAGSFLRRQLMIRLDMYRMPELRFVAGSGAELGRLMRRVRRGRPKPDAGTIS